MRTTHGRPHDFQSGFSAFGQFVAAAVTAGAAADFLLADSQRCIESCLHRSIRGPQLIKLHRFYLLWRN
jgi:hypothetical protein